MEQVKIFYIDQLRMGIDGEGITTLVLLYECPLRCKWCLNKASWDNDTEIAIVSVNELLDEVMNHNLYYLSTGGGITFGGGEPLLHSRFIEEFANACPDGWKIRVETSLQVPIENLKMLIEDHPKMIDKWFVDIKTMDSDIYKAYTDGNIERVIDNLKYLGGHVDVSRVLIRIPKIPQYTDDSNQKESRRMLEEMGFTEFDEFEYTIVGK